MRHGKRGMSFEKTINLVNLDYKVQDIALINKRPTPIKVTKSKGTLVLKGYFEEKSTVDYEGIYLGRAIAFEAKTVNEKRFDLKNLHKHQMQHLFDAHIHGAISFLLVEIRPEQKVFYIPFEMLRHYWKKAAEGGRKSIPLDELEIYAYEVIKGRRVLYDYLAIVDKLESKKAISS